MRKNKTIELNSKRFPLNLQEIFLLAMVTSTLFYMGVFLLTSRNYMFNAIKSPK